jgi:hypothetical protein
MNLLRHWTVYLLPPPAGSASERIQSDAMLQHHTTPFLPGLIPTFPFPLPLCRFPRASFQAELNCVGLGWIDRDEYDHLGLDRACCDTLWLSELLSYCGSLVFYCYGKDCVAGFRYWTCQVFIFFFVLDVIMSHGVMSSLCVSLSLSLWFWF